MSNDYNKLSEYWKTKYSDEISKYRSYQVTEDFKQMAAMFAPGNSYYYVINFHDFQLEHISDSVIEFAGKPKEKVQLEDLLKLAIREELGRIELKEKVVNDFFTRFLDRDKLREYKLIYSYKMKDASGKIRSMLHQTTVMSTAENGMPEHVFSVHTDISHLRISSCNDVSFVSLKGEKSYFNVNTDNGYFDPSFCEYENKDLLDRLSEREVQIIKLLANGKSAAEIAKEFNLSEHTIKTHRRNILNKSNCSNTAELVAKCVTGGVLSISLN
ncbi:LuxR C-terminal-related transcriptional regulator [Gramella sp. GC03-9]|uniref:LuxR C-terminal-related transcriptional regulator n=1 Tax=Christiangramia oceanisediminis TaxID=2920386 RepID=A0A9X2KVT2_9FLAO|nr:LuxR C-terminal-related transcriptional regulator [Gramella oceanisediminis]MCP9199035.1 LuxR C-terminal-related transcriptional regulator [Gramella oceanisediminis]